MISSSVKVTASYGRIERWPRIPAATPTAAMRRLAFAETADAARAKKLEMAAQNLHGLGLAPRRGAGANLNDAKGRICRTHPAAAHNLHGNAWPL